MLVINPYNQYVNHVLKSVVKSAVPFTVILQPTVKSDVCLHVILTVEMTCTVQWKPKLIVDIWAPIQIVTLPLVIHQPNVMNHLLSDVN